MPNKRRKKWVHFSILFFTVLITLFIIAIGILYSQQERLVKLAVEELNKQLPGELVITGSEISVFRHFPYTSIGLKEVRLYGDKTRGRAICEAQRIYAGFSLPDILKQQYHVKVISLQDGHLDLVQDSAGKLNIAEATRMTRDTNTVKPAHSNAPDLDVQKLVLRNIRISFLDEKTRQEVLSHIDKIQASFRVDSQQVHAGLEGKMLVDLIRPGDSTLFRQKHLAADVRLSYNTSTQVLQVEEGKLHLEEAVFNIRGKVGLSDNVVDLHVTGDEPDFRHLFAFAPAEVAKELKHFRYDGDLSFSGSVKGKLGGGSQPLMELNFSCSNAWLHNTKANKKLDSLAFKGYYTNGAGHSLKTSELRLLGMRARPGEGIFSGDFVLRDFTDPKILMKVNSELELGFIGAFLGIKDLQHMTGHVSLKMNLKELVDVTIPEQSMSQLSEGIQSELTVRDLTFQVPPYPYQLEHLNLHASMKDGFVKLDTLTCRMGGSDLFMSGSLSDLPAIFHHQQKPVQLTLNTRSDRLVLKELLAFDTSLSRRMKEEISGFRVGLSLETSVDELRHPKPLPKGKLAIRDLNAAFKQYPHGFHDFWADLTIGDTALQLWNFTGQVDSSDLRLSARVTQYALWFEKVRKGMSQVAFDLRSQRLAMNDLLGREGRNFVPKDYQQETASNLWLRSKMDLEYDSAFKYANIKIANISGSLNNHNIRLDSISGNVKFSTDSYIKLDTLKGKIGRSDFNISMRLYAGKDSLRRKKENYLRFSSGYLDIDQLTNYYQTAAETEAEVAGTDSGNGRIADSSGGIAAHTASHADKGPVHADAFNIFKIPFIDFNASVNIGKVVYHNAWIKNVSTNLRMQASQQLYLDTLSADLAGGKLGAWGHFDGSDPKKIWLQTRISAEDINIEKLMLKLDYLGQDFVINKNIEGSLSGQVESYMQVHPDLTPMLDQTEARLDLEILNGQLVNFAPMRAMSSYFSDKNLNKVRFDTLRNTLTFKNGTLSIPDMNINSSLGFMEIAGKQSMSMQMEYYIRIPLKLVTQVGFQMLFGKKREEVNPDQVDAIEYRDKDRRVRFVNLKITGTPDAYKVHLGRAKKGQSS